MMDILELGFNLIHSILKTVRRLFKTADQANFFLSGRRLQYCGRHQADTDRSLA